MRKGTDLIGKPIIAFDNGKHVDTVEDLIFDQHTSQLLGFLVDEGGWRSNARVVPLGGVQAIGPDAVIVPSSVVIIDAERVPDIQQILQRDNVLKGKKIFTTDGRDLGTMVDLFFDERTGRIDGYEVSGGVFADERTGRSFVPAPDTFTIGADVAFVPPEVASFMEERVGDVTATLSTARATAIEGSDTVTEELSSSVRAATGDRAVERALGRRTREMVRTPTGVIVAAPGQIVTEPTIERAREFGREEELLAAVGMSRHGADEPRDAGDPTQGAVHAREGAGNLWGRVKEKMTGYTSRTENEVEGRQIKYALGRPVTRVILDEDDNVILNVGEIITHKAIERARAAGALDMLLESVYDREPDIRSDEIRAHERGNASLDVVEERRRVV